MIQEGVIRFKPVTIDYCEKENNHLGCPVAITQNKEIVLIIAFNKTNKVVKVSIDEKTQIDIAIEQPSVFRYGPLYYPVVEYATQEAINNLYQNCLKEIPIKIDLWKFIVDKDLQNVNIEFDTSEEKVSKITLFSPPIAPVLDTVFKITVHPLSYDLNKLLENDLTKEYLTYEEAQNELTKVAHKIPYSHGYGPQIYLQIEKVFKRKEYERQTHTT